MECKNCQHILQNEDNFCNNCGAKVIHNRLTFGNVANEAKERVFNLDSNKPLHTFIDLFLRPEKVIDGYIKGVRKRYINPFGYLTIAITIFGLFLFFFTEEFSQAMSQMSVAANQNEPQAKITKELNENMLKYQSLVYFLFIPLLALISKLVFLKNKKYNYVEHLLINTYGQAHISITSTLLYFGTVWFHEIFATLTSIITLINILYFAYVFKRLYGLSLLGIVLRTLLFLVVLFPIVIAASIIVWILLLLTGKISMQDFIEAEKAKREISYIASSVINWTS